MKTVNSEHTFSKELLQHLHILTQDGKINQDSNRKLKQILHLNQFIIPLLKKIEDHDFTLIDVGAGKSYLGFLLYDQYIKHLSHGKVIGIEAREDLIQKSVELAQKLSFSRMHFIGKTIEEILLDRKILQADIVTALHACNTATDEAIRLGIQKNARSIVLIPCCQAEVAATLKEQKRHFTKDPFLQLFRHPLHNRDWETDRKSVV